jgi:superfamily I DNA and RNA helicase
VLDTVFGENSNSVTARSLLGVLKNLDVTGTLYLGYPVLSTADGKVLIDGLLLSEAYGLVAFDLSTRLDAHPTTAQLDELSERQNQIYASIYNKLNTHSNLRKGRNLGLHINVISCCPALDHIIRERDVIAAPPTEVPGIIQTFESLDENILRPLNAAIQRVSTLRPSKRRENVTRPDSRGATIKKIEQEIANLDQWQNRGAIEYVDGPQRIRGLAGSGKTVVLALKAAYLHARHPEWTIAVTFQSRALYQQFRDLIRRFMYDQIEDEPDWSKLQVMHGWGSSRDAGVYSTICAHYGVASQSWRTAEAEYGTRAFEGACNELLSTIREQGSKSIFDAILIDEAQDFPTSFFRTIYNVVPAPRRIIWAYDDLQNLGDYEMPSERELFGAGEDGLPLVTLQNDPDKPREDIVLPVCYRNTPWALATAHALGFGLYRRQGMVQMFEEPSIWPRIGYELLRGSLNLGTHVAFKRATSSYPEYFLKLLKPEDAVQTKVFQTADSQYDALAKDIKTNLEQDELDPTDILIVLPSAYTSRRTGASIMRVLSDHSISAHLVGVTTTRDEVFQPNSVAITHIFRAKGNEAPMVYVVHAEFCQIGFELSRKRNILFTGMTRSRAWVRLYGIGDQMKELREEVNEVFRRNFELDFDYPDKEKIKQLARVHRDMSDEEQKEWRDKISTAGDVVRAVLDGDLPLEALPKDIRDRLIALSKKELEASR